MQESHISKKYFIPSEEEAFQAVQTIIRWVGDDPEREGLLETPKRVIKSYREIFGGYRIDPQALLEKTFKEIEGYDETVLLRNIRFVSHCEHHFSPIMGVAHVAYLPDKRVVGISKIARVVDLFARRLQIQEKLTIQIAEAIDTVLQPRGVAVVIEAIHQCMANRGIQKPGTTIVTSRMVGSFRTDPLLRRDFLSMIGTSSLEVTG